jgi:hypothetical protein
MRNNSPASSNPEFHKFLLEGFGSGRDREAVANYGKNNPKPKPAKKSNPPTAPAKKKGKK